MTELCKARPRIGEFCQAVEGILHKGFLAQKEHGRKNDAFVYILEGETAYHFDGYTVTAKAGDVLFLANDSIYSMDILSENYRYIFADFIFLGDMHIKCEAFCMRNSRGTESAFRRMLEKWRQRRAAAEEECLAIIYSVYAEIISDKSAAYMPLSKRTRLESAAKYISENFANEELTVEIVAEAAGMSESHFRRLFKSAYSLSPIKYINLIRIERAKELIRYGSDSFSQIAAEVGFANLYYFSRMFKKEVGCTPSEYKDEYSGYQKI